MFLSLKAPHSNETQTHTSALERHLVVFGGEPSLCDISVVFHSLVGLDSGAWCLGTARPNCCHSLNIYDDGSKMVFNDPAATQDIHLYRVLTRKVCKFS